MSELEEKLSQVLSNPQMMQQIMALAQSMGTAQPEKPPEQKQEPRPETAPPLSQMDLNLVQKMAGMASGTGVDANQRALLRALGPYVSRERVGKLEKAMRAAKMAQFASTLLQTGGR